MEMRRLTYLKVREQDALRKIQFTIEIFHRLVSENYPGSMLPRAKPEEQQREK